MARQDRTHQKAPNPRGDLTRALRRFLALAAAAASLALVWPAGALPPPGVTPPAPGAPTPATPPPAPPPDDIEALAARADRGDSASEHWDLTARFTSGHALFVRTMITNAGPGSNTAVVTGQVVFPDGRVHPFDNGRQEGRWEMSADRMSLKVGGSRLELNGTSRGFSKQSKKQRIQLDMRFRARPTSRGAGTGEPGVAATSIAPIEGQFQVADMTAPISVEGVVFLRHAWGRTSEAKHTGRWIDGVGGTASDGFVFWGLETPSGSNRQWLSIVRDGQPFLTTQDFRFETEGSAGPDSRYPVPKRLVFSGAGVAGHIDFGRERVRADPMSIIPQPFRWFLAREIAPRRILSDAQLELRTGEGVPLLSVPALVAVTWTNPKP